MALGLTAGTMGHFVEMDLEGHAVIADWKARRRPVARPPPGGDLADADMVSPELDGFEVCRVWSWGLESSKILKAAGLASPSSRGLWGGDALLSTGSGLRVWILWTTVAPTFHALRVVMKRCS